MKLLVFLLIPLTLFARPLNLNKIRYKTYFGKCPTKVVGSLTLKLVKLFEEGGSLKDIKNYLVEIKASEKYYLSNYEIEHNPLTGFIKFSYECPEPLVSVQIYKQNDDKSYAAILVEGGELYDPNYEVLLRSDHKLTHQLPSLALPVEEIDKRAQKDLAKLISSLNLDFRKKISEIILDEKRNITLILSVSDRPVSVFMGTELWDGKLSKLQKIINYMEKNKKIPVVINITNIKKVVVKFSDTI